MDPAYFSVDVETSGPSPSEHSLLALGACLVRDPAQSFYVELQPDRPGVDPAAVAVSGLSPARLAARGTPADAAMKDFASWVDRSASGDQAVFVALNAPFDWMFVADYLHRYVGRNPFGHSALDMKALFMGVERTAWSETSLSHMASRYGLGGRLPHHALDDAILQAQVFRAILREMGGSDGGEGA